MIAIDSSAVIAIALEEEEGEPFRSGDRLAGALIGIPTLVETRMALSRKIPGHADVFVQGFLQRKAVVTVDFSLPMYHAAIDAFRRFGKGQGHPAQLNFGDCLAYAVAKHNDVALLYKGRDFGRTDIRAAASL